MSTVRVVQPSAGLADRIAAIQIVEASDEEFFVLPGSGAMLGLQVSGRVRSDRGVLSTCGVTGIQTDARRYAYVGDTVSFLVRLTPQGANCFGVPSSELSGRNVALGDLVAESEVQELLGRVYEAGDERNRVRVIEEFVARRHLAEDPLIRRAVELIDAARDAAARVAHVARALGLSERQLERRFLACVGLTPKKYASLRRFERAVALAGTTQSLTQVALEAGYYDQSHFIREFRRFAGAPPGEVLRVSDSYNRDLESGSTIDET